MEHTPLQFDWDAFLVAVPSVALLLAGFFRIDSILANPKRTRSNRCTAFTLDATGSMHFTDPDGRPWPKSHIKSPGDP